MKNKQLIVTPLVCVLVLITCSCKKFIEVDPPKTQLVSANVFNNDATAISAMRGIYSNMMNSAGFASGALQSIAILAGLSSDELTNYASFGENNLFYENQLTPASNSISAYLWSEPYKYIYATNAVLEGIAQSTGISTATKKQLTGEAKFIRAFCYFYLTTMFGPVPLDTVTDYHITSLATRTPVNGIYGQIKADLNEARNSLAATYENGQRVIPSYWAATALLARLALYQGDWRQAEASALEIINNTDLFQLQSNLNQVFLKNSKEAIWQLLPVKPGFNTNEGLFGILTADPNTTALNDSLVHSFENTDNRKTSWIGTYSNGSVVYYFPYKYKFASGDVLTEYSMVIRLAEIYLIRAEARAHLNNIPAAQLDINIIRNRAGLANTTATDQNSLLNAIEQERKHELFTEWGHRWFDLKRTKRSDAVLAAIKSPGWQSTDTLYPIPLTEIQNNLNITQNPGY